MCERVLRCMPWWCVLHGEVIVATLISTLHLAEFERSPGIDEALPKAGETASDLPCAIAHPRKDQ